MDVACAQLSTLILIPVSSSRFSIPRNLSAGITIEPLGQVYFVRRPSLLSEMLQQLEWLSWTSLCRSACFDQHRNSVLECLNVIGMLFLFTRRVFQSLTAIARSALVQPFATAFEEIREHP